MTAETLFLERFGRAPAGVWSAPGRVNLIGEHTDYTGGLALPFAIDARTFVAIARSPSGTFRITSSQRSGRIVTVAPAALDPGNGSSPSWATYLLGVIWALGRAGHAVPPCDIAINSTVPAGAGLSSSAALECALALALSEYLSLDIDRPQLARLAQQAENEYVGVPCGLMDQTASMMSTDGHALYFDVGSGSTEHIPFDPAAAGLTALTIDTRAHHSLADGEYARRRADCEQATALLGLTSLAELRPADLSTTLAALVDDVLRRRVRHVVTENERVREVVSLLRADSPADIGPALSASHASLRDDFEVSCPELDLAAVTAEGAGGLGARMVGGGFGGSVIALVPENRIGAVEHAVMRAFASKKWTRPVIRSVLPAAGARRDR